MKKKFLTISTLVLIISVTCFSQQKTNNHEDKFIRSLLKRMTLEEKLGQMNQSYFKTTFDSLCMRIKKGEIGSLLNIDTKLINQIQYAAMKESRLGIPLIIGRDVIHGYKTIFPIPLGQAASFNPQVAENGARVAATESRENGIVWTFAPMLDISRDARWGRIAESLGEDPYLAGVLGGAMVHGFQGEKLSDNNAVAACVKHFVGYGAAEGGRDYNSTNIPIHLLRNVYLPPFQKAIEAGAATVMTSFNDNDGVPSSGNDFLLRTILRKEWKFDGFVVSDWKSMPEMIDHGFAKDEKDVARISLKAGMNMEMASETYLKFIKELVNEGSVSIKDVDNSVLNILRIKYRLGLFDNPYVVEKVKSTIYCPDHLQKARQAAVESAVLLKNNNILPLRTTTKIAVVGPMANATHDQLGTWSFDGDENKTITPLKALQTEYSNINYVYEPGLIYTRDKNTNFDKAILAAKSADVAVVFVGEEAILSGEAHSLSNINLIGQQSELIKAIKSTGKPVVMVVIAGRPLTIERDLSSVDAVLYNFHPGTMGGLAIMDLLFGKENPSGKLPVTFVREVGQIPMYYNHNNTGRPVLSSIPALDDIPVKAPQTSLGNTSYYLDSGDNPLYPFGYGLSYSRFEYSDLQLSANQIPVNGSLIAKATIKNISKVDGYEVVQLYVRDLVGSTSRPVKELKGFQKIFLKAGESKTIEFNLKAKNLAFYGSDLIRKTEPGDFDIWISKNSSEGLKGKFSIK